MEDEGYIKVNRNGNKNEIHIVKDLSEDEQRVIIDSILYAQYIPKKEADAIIKKLKELYPNGLKNKIRNTIYVQAFNRTQNNNLYSVLDNIDEAIEKNRKIKITICKYKEDGKLYDARTEVIDPYHIVTSNSRYYVICYANRKQLESRRIDRISKAKVTDEKRKSIKEVTGENDTLDLAKYMKEHIYMYSGKSALIKIKMLKKHIGYFIDHYGNDYTVIDKDEEYITIRIISNVNATYYWAIQYGELVEILEPISLRTRIKGGLEDILRKYKEN